MIKVFYLLILTVFITIYKRFIFPVSFVSGTPNIYLTPKIYLIDLLPVGLVLLELIYFFRSGFGFSKLQEILRKNLALLFFICSLLFSVFFSDFPVFSFYSFVRLVLYLPLFIFIILPIFNYQKSTCFLIIPIIFVSSLALLQWYNQHTLFGFFPFGEALFSSSSANAPLVNYFGFLRLRAFGTFSHPNILGGFLAICLTLVLDLFRMSRTRIERDLFFAVFLLGFLALYLSFSQGAWGSLILGLGILFLWFILQRKRTTGNFLLVLPILLTVFVLLWTIYKFPLDTVTTRRQDLTQEAIRIFNEHPLTGVGLGNFVKFSGYYWKEPVHNIYLLLLSEAGIIGFASFLVLVFTSIRKAVDDYPVSPLHLILLVQALFLGFFDHYLITSTTGVFLLWLVLGLSLRRTNPS